MFKVILASGIIIYLDNKVLIYINTVLIISVGYIPPVFDLEIKIQNLRT